MGGKSRNYAETCLLYAAQARPPIDAVRVESNPFRTETS